MTTTTPISSASETPVADLMEAARNLGINPVIALMEYGFVSPEEVLASVAVSMGPPKKLANPL